MDFKTVLVSGQNVLKTRIISRFKRIIYGARNAEGDQE